MSGGLISGELMSGGRMSGGRLSGGLKSVHRSKHCLPRCPRPPNFRSDWQLQKHARRHHLS